MSMEVFLRVLGHQLSIPGVKFVVSHALLDELKKKNRFFRPKNPLFEGLREKWRSVRLASENVSYFCRFLKAVFSDSGAILMASTLFGCV